jgi:hypothetical protein
MPPTPQLDKDQIVVAGTAHVYVAPAGTAMPTDVDDELNAAFVSLGYSTEDGVKFTDAKTLVDIRAHQSFYPVRRIITARDAMAEFTLLEWDQETVSLAFGGGSWAEATPGQHVYTPPDPEEIDERALVVDTHDGDRIWRIIIPSGLVTNDVESTFTRTGPALLPIVFGVIGADATAPWSLATNDDTVDGS